ncbi:hypothetical protein [Dactylosporangium sp. CA-139066]|uniref:hypothetical protein n=1 Tax=Dactylosporangium sp. CA-139066 TaxID=3239930 RepID=UPI003D93CD6B
MKVSAAEAARALDLNNHTIAKLLDAHILVGPTSASGRRQGVYVTSLETAQSVPPTTLARGDVAFHVGAAESDTNPAHRRTYAGWHAMKSLAVSQGDRRRAWGGVWNMTEDNADGLGGHAVCSVGGFIVDVAKVEGTRRCPCCDLAVFDLADPDDLAVSRYRGRRFSGVGQGSLFTFG